MSADRDALGDADDERGRRHRSPRRWRRRPPAAARRSRRRRPRSRASPRATVSKHRQPQVKGAALARRTRRRPSPCRRRSPCSEWNVPFLAGEALADDLGAAVDEKWTRRSSGRVRSAMRGSAPAAPASTLGIEKFLGRPKENCARVMPRRPCAPRRPSGVTLGAGVGCRRAGGA